MKALRWTGAALLSLLGGLLGLVGVLLSITLVLAPIGIPLLFLSRRLFRTAGDLVIPRKVRHPLEAISEAASDAGGGVAETARKRGKAVKKPLKKQGRRARRKAAKKLKKLKRSL